MNRTLKIDATVLAHEAAWMAKLRTGGAFNQVTEAVQVAAVLGALQLRRTDFEQCRETVIPAEGVGQDVVTVNAAKLAALLKGAIGTALVDVSDSGLSIEHAGRTVRIKATDDEFPAWPSFTPTDEAALLGAQQIARVLTSVGTDDTLPALTAVAFEGGAMVTTDRYRLTRITYADSGFTTLVPGMALRAFASGNELVRVEPGKHENTDQALVRLSSGGRSIVIPTPDCTFPQWRSLIPTNPPLSLMLRRNDLIAAAGGENVVITVENKRMVVCSVDKDGDVEIEQSVSMTMLEGTDSPFTVKLRTKYLTECLRGITCSAVRFRATAPTKPVMLTDVGGSDLHLIMPIK